MFQTLLASKVRPSPGVRPALAAVVLHFLIVLCAVRGTAATPARSRAEVRETIRLDLVRSEPESRRASPALPPAPYHATPAPLPMPLAKLDVPRLELSSPFSSPIYWSALTRLTAGRPSVEPSAGSDSAGSVFAVSAVDQVPELMPGFHPQYPEALRQTGVSGVVQMEYLIDSTGQVDAASIRVLESRHPAFSRSAIEAVRNARFKPARRGGHAVAVQARQSIRFTIE